MLTISLGAMSYFGDLLREAAAPRDVAVRLVVQHRERRLMIRLDAQRANDLAWKQGDRTVLVLAPRVHKFIANAHLQRSIDSLHDLEFVSHRARKCA